MTRRVQEILLLTLIASLIGALITIFILELKEAPTYGYLLAIIVWLLGGLLWSVYAHIIFKGTLYRAKIFYLGFLSPVLAVIFSILLLIPFLLVEFRERFGKVAD